MNTVDHVKELSILLELANVPVQKKAQMIENFKNIDPDTQAKLNELARMIMRNDQSEYGLH